MNVEEWKVLKQMKEGDEAESFGEEVGKLFLVGMCCSSSFPSMT